MQIHQLKDLLKDFDKNVIYDQDLKKKSWFNIGGKSKVFYKAENLKDLVKFLKLLDNKEKIFIIGAGSNTLISDNIFDGVVIKLSKNFTRISLIFSYFALKNFKQRLDPRKYNGAILLGLNGPVVKSHGGIDATGF